jgi:hypothetical protein
MLLEILDALLSFNLAWLFQLILNNLHWLFIFALLRHVLSSGKSLLPGMFVLMFILFSIRCIIHTLLHWHFIVFLSPLFFFATVILLLRIFIAGTSLQKHTVPLTIFFIYFFTWLFGFVLPASWIQF